MGRSTTPTYRVEIRQVGYDVSPIGWDRRTMGAATPESLLALVEAMDAEGMKEGLPLISSAYLIRQRNDEIVAVYVAPMFKVAS